VRACAHRSTPADWSESPRVYVVISQDLFSSHPPTSKARQRRTTHHDTRSWLPGPARPLGLPASRVLAVGDLVWHAGRGSPPEPDTCTPPPRDMKRQRDRRIDRSIDPSRASLPASPRRAVERVTCEKAPLVSQTCLDVEVPTAAAHADTEYCLVHRVSLDAQRNPHTCTHATFSCVQVLQMGTYLTFFTLFLPTRPNPIKRPTATHLY